MLDAIINGFFEAVNGMKDKNTELFEFLDAFDGTCVEAKNDNVQTWLQNAAGISKVSRSDTTNDLAFCATAEFNALADEVKAPFREEARKSCEAEIEGARHERGAHQGPHRHQGREHSPAEGRRNRTACPREDQDRRQVRPLRKPRRRQTPRHADIQGRRRSLDGHDPC